MHLGQARGLVIGLVQPGVAQEEVVDDVVAMVNAEMKHGILHSYIVSISRYNNIFVVGVGVGARWIFIT